MKKLLSLFLFSISLGFCTYAENGDSLVYSEINAAFSTGFYPGVIDKTAVLEKRYPDSVYLLNSQMLKGESLININRYDDAIKTFSTLQKKLSGDFENYVKCTYYLGKAYYLNGEYENVLPQMYGVCKAGTNGEFYADAVFYTACTYYETEAYSEAILPLEYIVENGSKYSKKNYDESVLRLFICYTKAGEYAKAEDLYFALDKGIFEEEDYAAICLYAAQNLEKNGKAEFAYNLYSQVVKYGYKNMAVIAMKKAYMLTAENKVKENSAEIFAEAAEAFADSPELVCEFWIRLGMDEYAAGEYNKATEYFGNARKLIDSGVNADSSVIFLYEAKILMEKNQDYASADLILENIENEIKVSGIKNIQDAYYSAVLQCKAKMAKWMDAEKAFASIKKPDIDAEFNYVTALYKQEKYTDCIKAVSGYLSGTAVVAENLCLYEVYAAAMSGRGNYIEAAKIYGQIAAAALLSEKNQIEYAKVLFYAGEYQSACDYISKTDYAHKEYIIGLCKINLNELETARNHFISYIKTQSKKSDFMLLAYFYKGYAEYTLGYFRDAYTSFIRFATEAPVRQNKYICRAYEYSAKAAIQNGDYETAALNAEQLISYSVGEEDKQKAVLLCAEIYASAENYEKSILILEPYAKLHSDFAIQCLFQIARNYEQLKKISSADTAYNTIIAEYPETAAAEEAMYALGSLYYGNADYADAAINYRNYMFKYVNGKFSAASHFYCGDSYLKSGAIENSIMTNRDLIKNFPDSIYIYGASKNLMNAYYQLEDYSGALATAQQLLKSYPEQAANDGIGKNILELKEIVSGTDRKLALKRLEYENLGGIFTPAGRTAGTDLVAIYAVDEASLPDAIKLAEELLEKQTEDSEKYYAALNADFLAANYRKKLRSKEAADMYLKAAEYYRSSIQASEAETAAALYGAVEAFKAAGLSGDARETAETLQELYPESDYANRGKALLK